MKRITTYIFSAVIPLLLFSSCFEEEYTIKESAVTFDKLELTMSVGDRETLTATVYPANASDKTVEWRSSSPQTVSADPGTGEIEALTVGTARITAVSKNGTTSAACVVTVED